VSAEEQTPHTITATAHYSSWADAARAVPFALKMPTFLPDQLTLSWIESYSTVPNITAQYSFPSHSSHSPLTFTQHIGYPSGTPSNLAESVEMYPVKVGDIDAWYFAYLDSKALFWNQDGTSYTLSQPNNPIDLDTLIAIAESLVPAG